MFSKKKRFVYVVMETVCFSTQNVREGVFDVIKGIYNSWEAANKISKTTPLSYVCIYEVQ